MSKFRIKPYKNVGDPSSKYGYDKDGKQFEADIQGHMDKSKDDYAALIDFAKSRGIIPSDLRKLLFKLITELEA